MAVTREKITGEKQHSPFLDWLLEGHRPNSEGPFESEHGHAHHSHPWWKVMCLTGLDYFSTLGYQPGIAALAAGALAPIATLILVLLTLCGAYPIYRRVAEESPHGEGSVAMLEHLLTWWKGKLFVLCLLGFLATDFVITITLSAADATAHLIENPLFKGYLHRYDAVPLTLLLIALLGGVFLKGFKEAIGVAVVLVGVYLAMNAVVVLYGGWVVLHTPGDLSHWERALTEVHGGNPLVLVGISLLLFPRLALGLSGFETGVAVMPLIKGEPGDHPRFPKGRIRNTRHLLIAAAAIMSVFLILSSLVTTLHIPWEAFREAGHGHPAGAANGRALAYLAHDLLGNAFGTAYDFSTIFILWFAGASAMAGLLNIVPRYLPRYGMAPEWTRANRPLVIVFTIIAFLITIIFHADVTAQGGAYATGVLVLMSSGAVAVTVSAIQRRQRRLVWAFGLIAAIFAYTTVVNVIERPDGLKIACIFIAIIVLLSFVSRIWRMLELRVDKVVLDDVARQLIEEVAICGGDRVRLVPNLPEERDEAEYARQTAEVRSAHDLEVDDCLVFVEVYVPDSSEFAGVLTVEGHRVGPYRVLRATGTAIPNGIAALLLDVRDMTGLQPHAYFNWGEEGPLHYAVRYFLSGHGDVAPVTREILRRVEPDLTKRPVVHAAG